jgi:hypothetical protein
MASVIRPDSTSELEDRTLARMTRSQQARAHEMDSERWSASKAARRAVRFQNSVVNNLTHNPVVAENFATEFESLHQQSVEIYTRRGFGDVIAAQLASNRLQSKHNPAIDPHAFMRMGIERRDEQARTVRDADRFVLSPNSYAMVAAAANTLDDSDIRFLYEKDFQFDEDLSRAGFILFPKIQHFCMNEEINAVEELIAVTWRIETDPDNGGKLVKVTTWIDCDGPIEVESFEWMRNYAAEQGHPYPDIMPVGYASAPLDLGDQAELEVESNDFELKGVVLPGGVTTGEFIDDAIRGEPIGSWSIKFVMAFTRLARQKKSVVKEFSKGLPKKGPGAPRPNKPQPHYNVRVVTLNESVERGMNADRDENDEETTTRKYRHQFVVKMHKVRQWYPTAQRHEVIWRGPFWKGPEGAPLLAKPADVYAVK